MIALMNRPRFSVAAPACWASASVVVVLAVQRDEHVGEIDAADHQAEQRVEHVLHQAVDHAGEGDADDDADGEIDDAAAHDESAELRNP